MRMRCLSYRWASLAALLAVASAAACGPDSGGASDAGDAMTRFDGGDPRDASPIDGAVRDDGRADAGLDARDVAVDTGARDTADREAGAGADPCAPAAVIDLDRAGTRDGNTVRYTGDSTGARDDGALRPSCVPERARHVVALRYTPRRAARLRVSTDRAATPMDFDTVLWVQSACAPSPTSLACNDDARSDRSPVASTAVTEAPVAAAVPVFIFVGGYDSEFSATRSSGPFELSVTELDEVSAGGACSPGGETSICTGGTRCVPGADPARGTCVANGALGAPCRAAMPYCDGALACSGAPGSEFSQCVRVVAAGGECDPSELENLCAAGTTCEESGARSICIREGALGGVCRATGAPCDAPSVCSLESGRCRAVVAPGGACDIAGLLDACAPGSTCVGDRDAERGTCVVDGAAGGRCRPTSVACERGLACNDDPSFVSSRCRTAVAVGAPCDDLGERDACAAGSVCVAEVFGEGGTCVADGARNGRCRLSGAACDMGLACNEVPPTGAARCRNAVSPGAECDPSGEANACSVGSTCLEAGSSSRCVLDGSADGRCRATGAPCEAGLACTGTPRAYTARCRSAVREGDACDPGRVTNACTSPLECVREVCAQPMYLVTALTGASAAFVDACESGTRLTFEPGLVRDDLHTVEPYALPFSVRFFGETYAAVWPSINGYATLGDGPPTNFTGGPGSLPVESEGPMVAPFWQDLTLGASPMSDVCVLAAGATPSRVVYVHWRNARAYVADATVLDFEVALRESGVIDFLYRRLEAPPGVDRTRVDGTFASIGMQSAAGARYVEYGGALAPATGVRFTPR